MFSIDQLGNVNPSFKIVKPWWDVFTDYIALAMLALAVTTGAKQATSGNLYCLPTVDCISSMNQSVPAFGNNIYCKTSNYSTNSKTVLIKLQNQGQYDFVNARCKQEAVHWFVSYFPFIILLQTVLLILASNFSLKFPPTMSVIENFVTLVNECYNTPGTCSAVSKTIGETAPIASTRESDSELHTPAPNTINIQNIESLESSEAHKAKTLHEKVRRFRKDNEKKNLICIYLTQAIVKSALSLGSIVINAIFYSQLNNIVMCKIDDVNSENYYNNNYFKCVNDLVPFFKAVFWFFVILIALYLILSGICWTRCVWWTCFRKNKYNFRQHLSDNQASELGKIKEASGDLAFMLYLLDLYNKFYSYKFSVFLSDKNEQSLKDFILTNIWPLKKLQEKRYTKDCGRTLILPDLDGIPKTVFEMFAVDKLILQNCTLKESDFKIDEWKKLNLRSLSLISCSLTKIPLVIFELHTLESLDLSRNNIQSIPKTIQKLEQLKIFDINDNNIKEGAEHVIAMKNLTANLLGNKSLELGYQPNKLLRLYIDEVNIKDEAKPAFMNIARDTVQRFDVPVVKYSQHQTPEIEQENFYTMTRNPKGLVLLFRILLDPNKRAIETQSLCDYKILCNLFKEIGYEAIDYAYKLNANNTVNDLKEKLSKDLNDTYDSLIIVFSGSGTKEGMCPYRGEVMSVETIVDELNNFESLQGKPKLIIIQSWLDPTVSKKGATDKEAQECLPEYTLNVDRPACDDVVIAYSTLQSCISPPGSEEVSWFVRALVDVFSYYAWKEDVLSLLKLVNDELYRKCIVRKAYKHVSPPQSTLTKKWYLFPGCFGSIPSDISNNSMNSLQSADQPDDSTSIAIQSDISDDPDSSQPSTSTSLRETSM